MWVRPWLCPVLWLVFLSFVADCIRLVRENGYRPGTYFYHMGNGGFAYHFNTETQTSIYFKCVFYEVGCHGRAIWRLGGRFRESQPHNHPPDPDLVGLRHFRENVLQKVGNGRFVSFQNIIDEERADMRYSRNVRRRMTLRLLRSTMYRKRRERYPKQIPRTLRQLTQALLQHPNISSTVDNQENLYAGSVTATDGSHHVAFISPRMMEFIESLKILQGDGTFKARPALPVSSQLFVIVTSWRGCVIPLAWFLMESRTISAYRAIFGLLKDKCPNLNPEVVVTDWEYAQQRGWQDVFPNAEIQGCLWHLCRAFVKKANSLGIMQYRQQFPDVLNFIRKACAIALLPAHLQRDGLVVVREAAFENNIIIAYLLDPFFNYVEEKWLENRRRNDWMNLFNVVHRTNNNCETHNRMLRNKTGAHRPNVYLFIEALATLEYNATLDKELLAEGRPPKASRRMQSVFTDRQMHALCNDLEEDVFHAVDDSIKNFLGRASHLFHRAFNEHVEREVGRERRM